MDSGLVSSSESTVIGTLYPEIESCSIHIDNIDIFTGLGWLWVLMLKYFGHTAESKCIYHI